MKHPNKPELLRIPYQSEVTGSERDYFVYLPRGFEQQDTWPVMLFLHGNGERGNAKEELDFARIHGPLYEAWVQKHDLPFVIINPQLAMFDQGDALPIRNRRTEDIPQRLTEGVPPRPDQFPADEPMDGVPMDTELPTAWHGANGWSVFEAELLGMVRNIHDNYKGDPHRTYVTGLSVGGFGTWHLASAHPEFFAAAAPVVAWPHPDQVETIADSSLPVWCFAGGRDQIIRIQYFYPGMNRLKELGHPDFRFTIEADMNHDVWVRTYAGEDIYNWMLQRRRD